MCCIPLENRFFKFTNILVIGRVLCEGIIKVGINVESVIPILSLCYNKEVQKFVKKDVYQPSLDFVLANFTAVDFRPLHKKPALMALDILRICQTRIQKGVWKDADELKQAHATKGTTEPVTREKKKNRRSWIVRGFHSPDNFLP